MLNRSTTNNSVTNQQKMEKLLQEKWWWIRFDEAFRGLGKSSMKLSQQILSLSFAVFSFVHSTIHFVLWCFCRFLINFNYQLIEPFPFALTGWGWNDTTVRFSMLLCGRATVCLCVVAGQMSFYFMSVCRSCGDEIENFRFRNRNACWLMRKCWSDEMKILSRQRTCGDNGLESM